MADFAAANFDVSAATVANVATFDGLNGRTVANVAGVARSTRKSAGTERANRGRTWCRINAMLRGLARLPFKEEVRRAGLVCPAKM